MSKLETILAMKENNNYTYDEIQDIADQMEAELGAAEMWNTLRPAFEMSELLENLEYIAREADI